MDRVEAIKRLRDFPKTIHDLAWESTIISNCINEYGAGRIITKEETLCKMVVMLQEHSRKLQEMLTEQAWRKLPSPVVIPHEPTNNSAVAHEEE